jgi:hypothetical protein
MIQYRLCHCLFLHIFFKRFKKCKYISFLTVKTKETIDLAVAKQPENVTVVIAAEKNMESQTWGKFLAID